MYRRADLSRTLQFVVALFPRSAATRSFAREFRAPNEDCPAIGELGDIGSLVAPRSGQPIRALPFRQLGEERPSFAITDPWKFAAMAGTHTRAQRDAAMARLIERVRKVE